ncbi:MAG: hypothetical protein Q7J01_05960 [Syntrophales bacterium]|nr:hypothetical protein [Syntrophales bacterium]
MKIESGLVFFLSLVCLLTASAAEPAESISATTEPPASLEARYVETRDGFIRQFAKAKNPVDDRQALAQLEKQIKTIVGPVRIEGFPKEGRINLLTLRPEPGFAQVDGLRFDSDMESLFVTTETLLEHYVAERPELSKTVGELSKTVGELSKTGDFYRRVFHSDAGVIYYADLPVRSTKGHSFAHAFLGVGAQDIGPFIPSEIFVFVSKGDRILLVSSPTAIEITEIPQCRSEWDRFAKKRSEALDVYRSSQLKDRKAFADSIRYEEQGFEAYHRCYDREAQNQQFFISLKRQAQSIVDRLQKD